MSLRSRRKNLAQGGVSVANGILGSQSHSFIKPALAGDRFFRPLKRAWKIYLAITQGGAPLHFVPLRLPWAKLCRQLRWLVESCFWRYV